MKDIREIKFVACAAIIVKTTYEQMYGRMGDKEFEELKESIKTIGQLVPIVVNQLFVLIDGHHRLRACRELGIEVLVEIRDFEDESEERRLIHLYNLDRRHMTDFARIEAVFNDEAFVREEARRRQLKALRRGSNAPLVQIQTDGEEKGRTDQKCADWARVSRDTYLRVRSLLKDDGISEEIKNELRSGKTDLKSFLSRVNRNASNKKMTSEFEGERYLVSDRTWMICGPFKDLDEQQISANSIALIFPTIDPSHSKNLTRDLGKFAFKFLCKGGFLVLFVQPSALGKVASTVSRSAKELDLLAVVPFRFGGWTNPDHKNPYAYSNMALYLIFWKPDDTIVEPDDFAIWFDEPDLITEDSPEAIVVPDSANHHTIEYLVHHLSVRGKIVCDPICQSGLVGVKAIENGSLFIGIEQDERKFKKAMAAIEKAKVLSESQNEEESEDEEEIERDNVEGAISEDVSLERVEADDDQQDES